ncbi:SDR family oxidoreductase [Microbacterium sp. NPDC091313]
MPAADMSAGAVGPGRVALVTGGASGIGLGIARALLEAELDVVVTDVREDHMDRAREALAAFSDRTSFLALDVTDEQQWWGARRFVEERHGRLHVLCLNAGIGILGSMIDADEAEWRWIVSVNLLGATMGVETFLPHLRAHGEPAHIVATSSMGGLTVANDGGIYSTAKFGVVALVEQLRRDLSGTAVGASVLCPAAVDTNIFDHERMRPERAAGADAAVDADARSAAEEFARTILAQGADPFEVGRLVVAGIAQDAPYIFTDRGVDATVDRRIDALLSAAGATRS